MDKFKLRLLLDKKMKFESFDICSNICSCLWKSVQICNAIGVISGLLQLFIYAYYYLTGSKVEEIIEKKEPNKLEQNKVQLSVIEGPCKV